MIILPGLLMLLNSFLTHNILTKSSKTYNQFNFTDKNETIGRINCSLYQLYIVYRCLNASSYYDYIETNYIFASIMIYDLIHYLFYVKIVSTYLHHIITIMVILFANSDYGDYNKLLILNHLLILFESTNPPMSLSWLGNKFGYSHHILFKIFGTLTFIFWSFVRVFYFLYYIYTIESVENQLLLLPFLGLNLFWFKALVKVYLKVLNK
jgi:hypothetical protein